MKESFKKLLTFPLVGLLAFSSFLTKDPKLSKGSLPFLLPGKQLLASKSPLTLSLKILSKEESVAYLKEDIEKVGYVPILISLENPSSSRYRLSDGSISIDTVEPKKIASSVKKASLPASLGLKIAGFIFWPFSIPSTMYQISALQNAHQMADELAIKSISEESLAPYSLMSRVFFLEQEQINEPFYVTLFSEDTLDAKVFWVDSLSKVALAYEPLHLPQENYYLTHES